MNDLYGNISGLSSILDKYSTITMPSAEEEPNAYGNTWIYTTSYTEDTVGSSSSSSTSSTSDSTDSTSSILSSAASSTSSDNEVLENDWGDYELSDTASSLYGNIHGLNAILSNYISSSYGYG